MASENTHLLHYAHNGITPLRLSKIILCRKQYTGYTYEPVTDRKHLFVPKLLTEEMALFYINRMDGEFVLINKSKRTTIWDFDLWTMMEFDLVRSAL